MSPRGLLSSPHAPHGSPTPTTTPDAHDLNMKAAGAAAELSAAAQRFITQQLSSVPSELELRPSSAGVGVGVWPKQGLARGTRYGPFLGKWTANAKDPSLAWEVSTLKLSMFLLPPPLQRRHTVPLVWRRRRRGGEWGRLACGGSSSWGLLSADFLKRKRTMNSL